MLNLGDLYTARGDLGRARAMLEAVVTLAQRVGNRVGLGYALGYLGGVAYREGLYDEAERHLREALASFRAVGGGEISQAWMIGGLAAVEWERGALDRSRELLAETLAIFSDRGYRPGIGYALTGFAALAALAGRAEAAARLLGAAEAIAREAYIADSPEEDAARRIVLERAAPALGEAAFEAARAAGSRLSEAEALALAREA